MTKIPPQNPYQGKNTQELLESIAWNNQFTADAIRHMEKRERIKFWFNIALKVVMLVWLIWLIFYLPTMVENITTIMMEKMGPMLMGGGGGLGAQVDPENIQKIMESLDLGAILGGASSQ